MAFSAAAPCSFNARAYAQTLTERLDRRLRQLTEERDSDACLNTSLIVFIE